MGTAGLQKRVVGLLFFVLCGVVASLAWSPATLAQEEREERDRDGRVFWLTADARPMLGVYLGETLPGEGGGVVVSGVSRGGPAEDAGIREGDVIVSIAGHLLSEPLDEESGPWTGTWSPERRLRALMRDVNEGEAVEVGVDREGESVTFTVYPEHLGFSTTLMRPTLDTLGIHLRDVNERVRETMEGLRERYEEIEWPYVVYPDTDAEIAIAPSIRPGAARDWRYSFAYSAMHGLDLIELNPGLGAYFGTSEGVLVADADEDSPLGLRAGDVVVRVEGRTVDDVAELRRILRSYTEDEEIEFSIWRDGAETAIVGTISRS